MTSSQGIFHYTQENILYAALYGSRTNYKQVILNYHGLWNEIDWSGSHIVAVCGDWTEGGYPSNGLGFGVYTTNIGGSGPAWRDGGSHLTKN